MDPYLAAVRLHFAPGVGPRRLAGVLANVGDLDVLLAEDARGLPAPARAVRRALTTPVPRENELLADWRRDFRVYSRFAADYPEPLTRLADPPLLLFVAGASFADWPQPNVVIVGSRRATPYGRSTAIDLARELAGAGAIVGSGLAMGVDAAAHEGALESGRTWAAVGHGPDLIYPREHAYLRQQILEDGGSVVSEYPPGTEVQLYHFPARNRILAALADAVVVVEGARRSGALITADLALDLGVPVLAVPGRLGDRQAEAPLDLLRQGATPALDAETVLAATGRTWRATPASPQSPPSEHATLFDRIPDGGSIHVDELAVSLGRPLTVLLSDLLQLELAGWVQTLPGKFVSRAKPRST